MNLTDVVTGYGSLVPPSPAPIPTIDVSVVDRPTPSPAPQVHCSNRVQAKVISPTLDPPSTSHRPSACRRVLPTLTVVSPDPTPTVTIPSPRPSLRPQPALASSTVRSPPIGLVIPLIISQNPLPALHTSPAIPDIVDPDALVAILHIMVDNQTTYFQYTVDCDDVICYLLRLLLHRPNDPTCRWPRAPQIQAPPYPPTPSADPPPQP